MAKLKSINTGAKLVKCFKVECIVVEYLFEQVLNRCDVGEINTSQWAVVICLCREA